MAEPEVQNDRTPASIDPTGILRLVFWLTYVAGTLIFLYSWLLAMVMPPPPVHDFTFVYFVRACTVGPMLISILMARWIWKIRNPLSYRGQAAMRIVLFIAWGELGISLFLAIALAIFR
jgi:hypothetical protein